MLAMPKKNRLRRRHYRITTTIMINLNLNDDLFDDYANEHHLFDQQSRFDEDGECVLYPNHSILFVDETTF